ncbi:hypothetical protein [Paenibacillus sp. FSL H3-0286]|uniref:hypothetical protein n=1 Tax=Paenibacillus sp. FSL H3-0286 TaxID=2921427 RepID=UPI00324BA1F0
MLMFSLEDAMKLIDINQAKLSALSDVRPNTIADLMKANTKRIEVETLENLLDALNGIAKSKGINKYFQIQDIFQYYNDLYKDNAVTYSDLINREEFEMIRGILSKAVLNTNVEGLEVTSITKLLVLHRELFINGILTAYDQENTKTENLLLSCERQLKIYFLSERKDEAPPYRRFLLTEKGKEFVRLLRIHGTS